MKVVLKYRKTIIGIALVAVLFGLIYLPVFPYRPYRLISPNIGWEPADKWLTVEHCDSVEAVFSNYGETYFRLGDRTVLISGKLKMNKEMTGNYSQKAEADWNQNFMDNIINNRGLHPDNFR